MTVEISKPLLDFIKTEVEHLRTGMVTVELAETSNKIDVVTRALIAEEFHRDRKKYRSVAGDELERIHGQIKLIRFGRVTIQVEEENGSVDIFTESRQRFPKEKELGG
jgi:hypothetical protein